MSHDKYFNLIKQWLISKGNRAVGKQVLPFYLIIAFSALVYIYMEDLSHRKVALVILALFALPLPFLCLNIIILCFRAKLSSASFITIEKNKVIIKTKSGHLKHFTDLNIKYFDGCFIDFINKKNLFESYALFGNEVFLQKVIDELRQNGFEVVKISEEKIY